MRDCRVLLDAPRSGAWNMALDEVLMDRAVAEGRPQLRIYGWDEPTVSLGYFQRMEERESHLPSRGCALVRRPSGGGAIVHDREVTYALAIAGTWRASQQRELCRRVHQGLAELLVRLGAAAATWPPRDVINAESDSFLCFLRKTEGDVVIGQSKVVGSAQRRGHGAVMQHGSILLQASPAAPELPGVEDLSPIRLARDQWALRVRDAVLRTLNLDPLHMPLGDSERVAAEKMIERKYGGEEWTARR
jgi:lipoate-protein ligase A